MRVTIKDVAKRAGVSTSTVSRVLNKNSVISPETTEQIHKAMRDLNYIPNDLARSFAKASSHVIGLVVDTGSPEDYSNRFFCNTVFALESAFHKHGYNLMVVHAEIPDQDERGIIRLIQGKKIDGIIIPEKLACERLIAELQTISFPFVVLGKRASENSYSWVDIDNMQAGGIAARYLYAKKYQEFYFLVGSGDQIFEKERIAGFSETMKSLGVPTESYHILAGEHDEPDLKKTLELKHVKRSNRRGFLCSSDRLAAKLIHLSSQMAISVPEQVGVLCFDNTDVAECMVPAISCIDVDTYEQGAQAAELLLKQMQEKEFKCRHILIPTKVIERDSTGGLA